MEDEIRKIKEQNNALKMQYKDLDEIKKLLQDNNQFTKDFEPLKYINSGSCGIVYEGKIKRPQVQCKRVALKFIFNKLLESKREEKKLLTKEKAQEYEKLNKVIHQKLSKEIKLQTKVKHKNITSLYGVYDIQNKGSCMILEFAKYGDLEHFQKKLLKKQTLSETLLAYIAKQILMGLYYCHQSKIIHMDIKQQNILICDNLQIKISDFSVSYCYGAFPAKSFVPLPFAGTSLFMSPEVLGKKTIPVEDCSKIDIFSFGILLYHLAFADYPYGLSFDDRKSFSVIQEKIKNNTLVIPKFGKYSNLFRNFLKRLLDKNLFNRISIEQALKEEWILATEKVFDEKEKVDDLEKFILSAVSDSIKSFNDYLKKHDQ